MQKQFQSIVDSIQSKKFQKAIDLCQLLLQQSNHPQIHLFLAIAYGENGNNDESYNIFENLIKHFPNNSDIYYNYALILHNNKQQNKAIIQYNKCLNHNSKNASAWNNLGEIYRSELKFEAAQEAFFNCLKLEPNNIQYNRNLALNYYQNKNFDKAVPVLLELIKSHDFEADDGIAVLDSLISLHQLKLATETGAIILKKFNSNEEILNLLGLIELEKRRFKQSIKYLKQALAINPDFFSALCHLASAYLFHGKIKKSKKLLKKILLFKKESGFVFVCMMYETNNLTKQTIKTLKKGLILFPQSTELLLIKVKTLKKQKKYQHCLTLCNKILNQVENNHLKASTLYEKGQSLDKLHHFDSAWEAFVDGNKLRLEQWQKTHANKDPFVKTCSDMIKSFEHVHQKIQRDTNTHNGENLIFIVGFPRSGTTLLDSILSAHSEITVLEEAPIIGETYDQIENINSVNYAQRISELSQKEISELRQFYFKSLKNYSAWDKQGFLVDKSPLNTLHVAFIHTVFPKAKIIFSQRHPLDVCISCFFQDFKMNDFMTNMTNIVDSAKTYDAMLNVWITSLNSFKIDVFYQSYEQLVSDFENQTRNLFKHLNIPWQNEVLDYQKTLKNRGAISTPSYNQVNQKIYQSAKNRYINYKHYLDEPIKVLDPWIKYFSYNV